MLADNKLGMTNRMLSTLQDQGYELYCTSHADIILQNAYRAELMELVSVLSHFHVYDSELVRSGGGEGQMTQRLRRQLAELQWRKAVFTLTKTLQVSLAPNSPPCRTVPLGAPSHEIDHVRFAQSGTLALEIEWNNKDPFYDRDLENFQRLHHDRAITAGIIVTRGSSLQSHLVPFYENVIQRNGIINFEMLGEYIGKHLTVRQMDNIDRQMESGQTFSQAVAGVLTQDKYGQATTHWQKLMDRIHRHVGAPCPLLCIGVPASKVVQQESP